MASLFCRVFRSAVCATRRTFAHLSPASPVLEASLVGPERARENSLSRSKGQGKGSMLRSFQCSSMAPPPRPGRRRAKKTPRRKAEENLDLTLLSLSPPTGPPPRPRLRSLSIAPPRLPPPSLSIVPPTRAPVSDAFYRATAPPPPFALPRLRSHSIVPPTRAFASVAFYRAPAPLTCVRVHVCVP